MGVIHRVKRGPLYFHTHLKHFRKKMGQVAEWSALQTGKRGDSSSIPAEVKIFLLKSKF